MKLEFNNLNPENLAQDLKAKGIDVVVNSDLVYGKNTAANIYIEVEEIIDVSIIQSIIDAHDPTPISPIPNEIDALTNYVLDVDMRLVMVEMGLI